MAKNEYSTEPNWYIVHTYTGYENKVKKDLEQTIQNRGLEDYIFKIIVPMEEKITIENGQRISKLKKVFPGYVLIKMIVTEKTWYVVRNTTGVTGFVGAGTTPIPLTPEEVRKMGFEISEIKVDYEVGDLVEVLSGPLAGYNGRVEEIDSKKENVKLIINMFGREVTAEVEVSQVQKLTN